MGEGGHFKVCCRLRPLDSSSHRGSTPAVRATRTSLEVTEAGTGTNASQDATCWGYTFDEVLAEASQQDVYTRCAQSLVEGALNSNNGCILAYGQTGSGKTHTVCGGGAYEDRGIIARSLHDIYQGHHQSLDDYPSKARPTVSLSFLEVYNEQLYDLLQFSQSPYDDLDLPKPIAPLAPVPLQISQGPDGSTRVRGLTIQEASSEAEALALLAKAEEARAVATHQLNDSSSRSHVVFTIHLSFEGGVTSKLDIVDLAGSERVAKTGSAGKLLKEASHINVSLTFLEQVTLALAEQGRSHVPYRSSKLTHILKDSLGCGSCRTCQTCLIATVWPCPEHLSQSLRTLNFAQRMSAIQAKSCTRISRDGGGQEVQRLQAQVRVLREEVRLHDMMAGTSRVVYGSLSEEQLVQLQAEVGRYVMEGEAVKRESCDEGEQEGGCELRLTTVAQVRAAFSLMRELIWCRGDGCQVPPRPSDEVAALVARCTGFEVEVPTASHPSRNGPKWAKLHPPLPHPTAGINSSTCSSSSSTPAPCVAPSATVCCSDTNSTMQEAFKASGEGKLLRLRLQDCKASLKQARSQIKQLCAGVNLAKKQLDEAICTHGEETGAAKDARANYRARFRELQRAKEAVKEGERGKSEVLEAFAEAFERYTCSSREEAERIAS
ncbi:unnamed protein product [Chrysoparadoxa australica]